MPVTYGGLEQTRFGRTGAGEPVTRFTLRAAGGMRAEVLDYGAALRALHVPAPDGSEADVVLGYDDVASYERDPFYLGVVVGRNAGRIAGGSFELDGLTHRITRNDGDNHLHGGTRGFGKALWRAVAGDASSLTLEHLSPAGDQGYPGTLRVRVTYSLGPGEVLAVEYRASCDQPTPVNLTQHSYFNLAGEGSGDVLGHQLTLHAARYTPVGPRLIPSGEIAPVAGTPFDFRDPAALGARIGADHPQLRFAGGYDHTLLVDGTSGTLRPAARLLDPGSGRAMELWTSEPALQLYSGNFLDGSLPGKHGHRYGRCAGVCLETQHLADTPNQPGFPSTVLRPGETLLSRTEFRFGVAGPA